MTRLLVGLRRPPVRRRILPWGAAAALILGFGVAVGGVGVARAEVPSGWTEIARDGFGRSISSGWGSAEVGGPYRFIGGGAASVSGSAGVVRLSPGPTAKAYLNGVSQRNIDLSDSVTMTTSSPTYDLFRGWDARIQSDGTRYSGLLRTRETGRATLSVSRVNGTSSSWLSGVVLPFTVKAGDSVRGEIQITGTSPVMVNLRAWKVGSSTPNWQLQYSDSSSSRIQAVGAVGVYDYVQAASSAVTFSHDNLSVGSNDTPSATPPPTPTPTTGGRGAAPIGSAAYTVPSGAVFVDGAKGNNANSGSQSSPLKTIAAATGKVASGGSVVLRSGAYHESVSVSKSITIQNYPNEAVWLDGSVPVAGWAKSGSTWVHSGWTKEFSSSMGVDSATKARFIGSNPMAADPDQVFVNGVALRQVASASSVTAGTFAINDSANTITIGTDPSGKEVRASDLGQAVSLSGSNSILRGIGIRRYANGYELRGALKLSNPGGEVRDVVIQDVATIGISLSNSSKVLDHVTVQRAGQLGIGGHQTDRSRIANSIVSNNNTEDFKVAPVAGGIKITSARGFSVKNNDVSNNKGNGVWFDVSSYDMTIVNNTVKGSAKNGISVEVSDKAIVANNIVTNGGETGIIVFNSSNVKLFNNEVGGSSLFGIKLAQDERRQASLGQFGEARDSRVRGVDPTVTWVNKNIQLSNNVFGGGGRFQFYALDGVTRRAVDTWNVTINGNLFTKRVATTDPTMVAWGKGDNSTLERYESPAALAAAKNSGWKNAQTPTLKLIDTMTQDKSTYSSVAVALPSDVAEATGLPMGSKILGTR